MVNPSVLINAYNQYPRNEEEVSVYRSLRDSWRKIPGAGSLLGIWQLTSQEEAELRRPGSSNTPAQMNPFWNRDGVVTAIVHGVTAPSPVYNTVNYKSLLEILQVSVNAGIRVELVACHQPVPTDHRLAFEE